jgi:hypothetical protein
MNLYLAWKNPQTKVSIPIGILTYDNENKVYKFSYLANALMANKLYEFEPLFNFPDFFTTYSSTKLPPFFSNRILNKNREEYKNYMAELGLSLSDYNPLKELGLTEGIRQTDPYSTFLINTNSQSSCIQFFLISGSLLIESNILNHYLVDDKLTLTVCNNHKVLIYHNDIFLGYMPKFLLNLFSLRDTLNNTWLNDKSINLVIHKINNSSIKENFKILCKLEFSNSLFQDIIIKKCLYPI